MQLNATTTSLLIAWYVIGSLVNLGLLGLLTLTLVRLNARMVSLEEKVDPALRQTEALLAEANVRLATLAGSAERVLSQSEAIAAHAESRTTATLGLVQRVVYLPFVHVNALLAGCLQTAQTFGALQHRRQSGVSKSDPERNP